MRPLSNLLFLTVMLFCVSVSSIDAQNVKRRTANTHYLHYPELDVSDINSYTVRIHAGTPMEQDDLKVRKGIMNALQEWQDNINNVGSPAYIDFGNLKNVEEDADINIEFAFGDFEIIGKSLKQHQIPCKPEGVKLTKETLRECPAFYYEVSYRLPSILRITSKTGEVLYLSEPKPSGKTKFGFAEASGHLKQEELDAAYTDAATSVQLHKNMIRDRVDSQTEEVQECFSFYYQEEKLPIATGAGKNYDYTTLEFTQAAVLEALEDHRKRSTDPSTILRDAIMIWTAELEQKDLNDKEARINRKIAIDLMCNKAIAHMYLYEHSKAFDAASEAIRMFDGMANKSRLDEVNFLLNTIRRRQGDEASYLSNGPQDAKLAEDAASMIGSILVGSSSIPYEVALSSNEYASFKEDLLTYEKVSKYMDNAETASRTLEEIVLSMANSNANGETKDFKSRLSPDEKFKGSKLHMYPFAGDSYETLPPEVCELTELTQLYATGMDRLRVIPPQISQLQNLRVLKLYSNGNLEELPDEIGELENLEELDVSFCTNLKDLPESVKNLKNLRKIKVNNTSVPSARLDQLREALPNCKIR